VDCAETIDRYGLAVEQLAPELAEDLNQRLLSVLIARDALHQAVKTSSLNDVETLSAIAKFDEQFRGMRKTLSASLDFDMFATARRARLPEAEAWWWNLAPQPQRQLFKTVLTPLLWLSIAIALSFTVEFLRRLLSVGGDALSAGLQGLLAVLVGGSAIQYARHLTEQKRAGMADIKQASPRSKLSLAAALIVIAAALLLFQRSIADYYIHQGDNARRDGNARCGGNAPRDSNVHIKVDLTQAIQNYQRAISLTPDQPLAHTGLAQAYEDVREFDKAVVEYQTAILLDDKNYLPYNNLARLFILHRKDYAGALNLLDPPIKKFVWSIQNGRQNNSLNSDQWFAFFKNHGWANYSLGYYNMAEGDLNNALALRKNAVAYYLLGKVAEALNKCEEALKHWQTCREIINADPCESDEMEAEWISHLNELNKRILKGETRLCGRE